MNSNANSPAAERSRFFIVRLVRAVWRFVWSRRMVWTLAVLASLSVLFYQYENWNGARELAAARKKMIARAGTDNFMDLLPPEVPEEENFYAIPEIKSWRVPSSDPHVAGGFTLRFPAEKLLPPDCLLPDILEEPGSHRLNLEGWVKARAAAGRPIPANQTPAQALMAELRDENGIIAKLLEGLTRPHSQIIPSRRSSILEAHGELKNVRIPAMSHCFATQRHLGLHLRAAALAGDAARTRDTAGVMLRLADGAGDTPLIVCNLVSLAFNDITLDAINEAAACPALTGADLRQMQEWLAHSDDVRQTERMFLHQALASSATSGMFRAAAARGEAEKLLPPLTKNDPPHEGLWRRLLFTGPSGWLETNAAFATEMLTGLCGDGGEETWRSGTQNAELVRLSFATAGTWFSLWQIHIPNFRRALAVRQIPAMSNIWQTAVKNLFHRRCAILTCGLHRYRLAHGSFPESLAGLDALFIPGPQNDPAKAGAPLNYRRTEKGFLLWSVGDDRNDDSGDADKDWLWRHELR